MYLKVRVKTKAKNESVNRVSDDHFEVSVREKPEGNAANARVLQIVARELGVPVARLRITKGHHSPSKILAIT